MKTVEDLFKGVPGTHWISFAIAGAPCGRVGSLLFQEIIPRSLPCLSFLKRSRCEVYRGTDACFAPVLNAEEAWENPHNKARGTLWKPSCSEFGLFSSVPPLPLLRGGGRKAVGF